MVHRYGHFFQEIPILLGHMYSLLIIPLIFFFRLVFNFSFEFSDLPISSVPLMKSFDFNEVKIYLLTFPLTNCNSSIIFTFICICFNLFINNPYIFAPLCVYIQLFGFIWTSFTIHLVLKYLKEIEYCHTIS